jgi:hypothetical protein
VKTTIRTWHVLLRLLTAGALIVARLQIRRSRLGIAFGNRPHQVTKNSYRPEQLSAPKARLSKAPLKMRWIVVTENGRRQLRSRWRRDEIVAVRNGAGLAVAQQGPHQENLRTREGIREEVSHM